ncbi:MAG: GNAT family N-acetyltransferase [Clostridiales bacterium]|jgi:ribosomal protein S18 acetylase RimI-like enzyme|nr:GNAT family N-acetyltransferase [Clostridiales bacterium]
MNKENVFITNEISEELEKQIINLDKESFTDPNDYWEENKSFELFKQNKKIELAAINKENNELMGYILCLILTDEEYKQIRIGNHLESDIEIKDVISKDELKENNTYSLYFSIIAIKPEYRRQNLGNILLESLNEEIEKYKQKNIHFSKILSYVVSNGGHAASGKLGLKEVGKNIEGAVVMERIL